MRHTITTWTALLILSLMLAGCGGEPDQQGKGNTDQPAAPAAVESVAMIIEASEPTYWRQGEEVQTIDDVRVLVRGLENGRDAQHTRHIDESYERAGQLRVVFQPKPDARLDKDLKALSDEYFQEIKLLFDQHAKQALHDELAHHQSTAQSAAEEVKKLQQALQAFQEVRRGLPQTDESRLERRKLERKIETTLQSQIDADKRVASLQKRIDRERYVTLLRVR